MKKNKHTIAIEFSGGRESLKLAQKYNEKKPLLLCYVHKGMESMVDLIKYYAEKEGLDLYIHVDLKAESFRNTFALTEVGRNLYRIIDVKDPLIPIAKKLGIKTIIQGRKHKDFIERGIIKPHEKIQEPRNLKIQGIKILFPLWSEG